MSALFDPRFQAVNASGVPYVGAQLTFYQSGTTTKIVIYSDAGLTTPQTNPATADSEGKFGNIFLGTDPFKFVLTISATDNTVLQSADAIPLNAASALDADLVAIGALSGTGMLARTGSGTWSLRTVTAGTGISISNGDGVGGNPTISISGSATDPTKLTGPVNMSIAASAAASALTVALKGVDGTDPSASNPVYVPIRNSSLTVGTPEVLTITSALSLVVSSGSTLGFTSGVPGRLWVVLFNDAGTPRIGVVNCLSGTNLSILGLEPGTSIASTTAEGGAGAADSSQTFYTDVAVTSKAYAVIGRLDWTTALGTAGAWSAGPNIITPFREGIRLPGTVRLTRLATSTADVTGTTVLPDDDTIPQSGEGVQMLTMTVTPNACDLLEIEHVGYYSQSNTSDSYVVAALFQDSTASALAAAWGARVAAANARAEVTLKYTMIAGTGSSTTFKIRAGSASAGTIEMNGKASGRLYGGVMASYLKITEITT